MKNPVRVLFLRSHSNAEGSTIIANGLFANKRIEFRQYPRLPEHYRAKVKSDEEWQVLHQHMISTPQELKQCVYNAEFDLVLLADKNGWLFEFGKMRKIKKLQCIFRLYLQRFSEAYTKYAYLNSLPFSVQELSRLVPLVVVDLNDIPYLKPEKVEILHACLLYFKREVPYNRFAIYHPFRSAKYRNQDTLALFEKILNIPLGIGDRKFHELLQWRAFEQDIDIFWVGQLSSTIRVKVAQHLQELAAKRPWKIHIPSERLSFQEYCRTVARSKITISVEGDGWDCFRHYEAVALGSVPLINKPTIDAVWWHQMPQAIYFENDFSNFDAQLEQLLNNDALRAHCLQEMEQKIEAQMLWSKIIDYILDMSMQKLAKR